MEWWGNDGWTARIMITLASLAVLAVQGCDEAQAGLTERTPPVDLERYLGRWYEIARFPAWFQRGCVHSWATYSPGGPDSVDVLNECITESGQHRSARGVAKVVDPINRSKLEVVFDNWFSRLFPFLTRGKYWIFYVDSGYQLAVVGDPSRKYLWFLSRSPVVDDQTYQTLVQIADGLRFETRRLLRAKPR